MQQLGFLDTIKSSVCDISLVDGFCKTWWQYCLVKKHIVLRAQFFIFCDPAD